MKASPALLRARAPYLIKNTITGFAICTLVIGICTPHLPFSSSTYLPLLSPTPLLPYLPSSSLTQT